MRTNDGLILRGSTPEELVTDLMRQSFDAPSTLDEFMRVTAQRVSFQTRKHVRVDTPANFVTDLTRCGLLIED